jgi:signal transduction histidine kinase
MAVPAGTGIVAALMGWRLGLQGRMTVSYVLATVAIVVFVEGVAGALVLPRVLSGQDVTVRALDMAATRAKELGRSGLVPGVGPSASSLPQSTGKDVGKAAGLPVLDAKDGSTTLILDTAGRVVWSSNPSADPVGAAGEKVLPAQALALVHGGAGVKSGVAAVEAAPRRESVWALVPIRSVVAPGVTAVGTEVSPKDGSVTGTVGYIYVTSPATTGYALAHKVTWAVAVVVLTIPVGAAFGLLTTRRLRRRLRHLADASQAVAAGEFDTRVDVASGGADEVGKLERNFNEMTARLGTAAAHELELASQNARLAERSRISRELHDSVSQDLFSLSMLSAGLQRALPADSPLQPQVARIAETVATAIHEMRALVLDLHPTALAEKGLVGALDDLCASYRARLGLSVTTRLETVALDDASQHAVLRVAQEALANAAKHADPSEVTVSLQPAPGSAVLIVSDDGRGFDAATASPGSGLGLRLMRERVAQVDGSLSIESTRGAGTTVRLEVPAPSPPAECTASVPEPAVAAEL